MVLVLLTGLPNNWYWYWYCYKASQTIGIGIGIVKRLAKSIGHHIEYSLPFNKVITRDSKIRGLNDYSRYRNLQ